MSKLWGGRFEGKTHALVEALGESVSFDARLAPWDITASIAHARMLGDCGIIPKGDAAKIIRGLKEIAADISAGRMAWSAALEDVHTNIEAALVAKIGDPGKRLHTGRSRNDQIATDVRLWLRDQTDAVVALLRELRLALARFAEANLDVILPGFTHLQHAQPVLLAHHLLAYTAMFARDQERFIQMRRRVNVMPLGSAALAGTPYPVDRAQVAKELGFDALSGNSMDAVSDRDSLVEFCANCSLVMAHLSRLSEELVLWSSQEFGFVEIGDAFTTGSSIMPQKKNPDVAELVRGKTGRVYGDLVALLTLIKGLPLTYNRDLQEDKEPVFHASDTVQLCLAVYAAMIPSISVRRDAVARALRLGFMEATDLADYLVRKGMPFREAHGVVGRIVRRCIELDTSLPELPLEEYSRHADAFGRDVYDAIKPGTMVRLRDTLGATSPRRVRAALRRVLKELGA